MEGGRARELRALRAVVALALAALCAACSSDPSRDAAPAATASANSAAVTSTTPPDPAECEAHLVVPRTVEAMLPEQHDGVVTTLPPPFDPAAELANALSAAAPCQYSGIAYDADGSSLLAYATPLDAPALAAIDAFTQLHPLVKVTPRAGAQPEVVGELQRARVSPVLTEHHATGGIGVGADGSINVQTSAPTADEVKQLEADVRAAVAMKTPLEQQLPAAEPNLDITIGGPRFSPN